MATSPVPYPEKKLGQAEPIYRAGFGKGVAETAKEWEEWAGENYYWNRYFSHPPDEHSPSSILATSIPDEQHLRTTPHYRAVSILSLWLANGSRRIPREMVDRASQIDFIHGRIHD